MVYLVQLIQSLCQQEIVMILHLSLMRWLGIASYRYPMKGLNCQFLLCNHLKQKNYNNDNEFLPKNKKRTINWCSLKRIFVLNVPNNFTVVKPQTFSLSVSDITRYFKIHTCKWMINDVIKYVWKRLYFYLWAFCILYLGPFQRTAKDLKCIND